MFLSALCTRLLITFTVPETEDDEIEKSKSSNLVSYVV